MVAQSVWRIDFIWRNTGGVVVMKIAFAVLVGGVTGILSGFGIGGGSLLLLYLTMCAGIPQYQAGGINLLYFIACAPAALYSHIKNKLVHRQAVLWSVLAGIPTSALAALAAARINTDWLRRAFGIFLLYVGIKEICAKKSPDTNK